MSLTHAAFAIAGIIAAAGPVLIHLWNRRRYRTVSWGAMEFLSRAVGQTRRRVQLRDLLLLLLRMLAVVLFGLVLARPLVADGGSSVMAVIALVVLFVLVIAGASILATSRNSRGVMIGASLVGGGLAGLITVWQASYAGGSSAASIASGDHPVHAIFVIDNSQSMATRLGKQTRLDAARHRAIEALAGLPSGSRVHVIPLCGAASAGNFHAHRHARAARAAIERIPQTDQAGMIPRMFARIAEVAKRVPELPEKRVVFLTDLQAAGWPEELTAATVPSIPFQIVPIDQDSAVSNLFIESFATRDGFVEFDAPATFLASAAHLGSEPIEDVEITLWFNETVVASEIVDFQPGQQRSWQWRIPMNIADRSDRKLIKSARVTVRAAESGGNRLARDDAAYLVVPVVHALPVLFVDQYGEQENLDAGRMGETYRLRRLLAPHPPEGVHDPFVAIRQTTIDQLNQALLADVRLVVIAGIESPAPKSVSLLRAFVEQGGVLLIAAGANFDPARWNEIAWRGGSGILPAPLAATPRGVRPSQAVSSDEIVPRRLDMRSLRNSLFQVESLSEEELDELWRQPFFFQIVETHVDESVREIALSAERQRIRERRANPEDPPPAWLNWRSDVRRGDADPDAPAAGTIEELARRRLPVVLARFEPIGDQSRGLPYLVERQLGFGRVVFLAGGISSDWDTLSKTNAIILLDRLVRSLIEQTLPHHTITAGVPITLPSDSKTAKLTTPDGTTHPLRAPAGEGASNLRIEETRQAGIYQLQTGAAAEMQNAETPPLLFAVNGPKSESDLKRLDPAMLDGWRRTFSWNVVGQDEPILLTGGAARSDWPWRWLAGLVLGCLLLEMLILTGPRLPRREVSP